MNRNAPAGKPFQTAEVDAREGGKQSRVAAEWTRPGPPGAPTPDRAISRREMADQLREAKEAADQAMEDQVIPTRYRNVQEFYKRALKRAEGATPAPPAPAAKDAEKKD